MTTKNELYKIIDELNEAQLDNAKEALTNVLQGKSSNPVPVCDLGSPEDVATLYECLVYGKKNKI